MLEFIFTHNKKQFKSKAKEIADEIMSILASENIDVIEDTEGSI